MAKPKKKSKPRDSMFVPHPKGKAKADPVSVAGHLTGAAVTLATAAINPGMTAAVAGGYITRQAVGRAVDTHKQKKDAAARKKPRKGPQEASIKATPKFDNGSMPGPSIKTPFVPKKTQTTHKPAVKRNKAMEAVEAQNRVNRAKVKVKELVGKGHRLNPKAETSSTYNNAVPTTISDLFKFGQSASKTISRRLKFTNEVLKDAKKGKKK